MDDEVGSTGKMLVHTRMLMTVDDVCLGRGSLRPRYVQKTGRLLPQRMLMNADDVVCEEVTYGHSTSRRLLPERMLRRLFHHGQGPCSSDGQMCQEDPVLGAILSGDTRPRNDILLGWRQPIRWRDLFLSLCSLAFLTVFDQALYKQRER